MGFQVTFERLNNAWQPIVTAQTVKISSHKEQKTYILATPHRHNITIINTKEQQ